MNELWCCPACEWTHPMWPINQSPPSSIYNHIYEHDKYKEKKMNDQMEQVWRSKDGNVTGSKEEVEAYLKSKSPLAGMRFPYERIEEGPLTALLAGGGRLATAPEVRAIVAFANLAEPGLEMLKAWDSDVKGWRERNMSEPENYTVQKFLLAYEEALKQVPQ